MPTDTLGRTPISDGMKQQIAEAFAGVKGRGAAIVIADKETMAVRLHLAAKIGDHWKVAGGGGVPWTGKKPEGWFAIEATW